MYSEVGMYRNEKCNFLKNIWPHYVTQKCAQHDSWAKKTTWANFTRYRARTRHFGNFLVEFFNWCIPRFLRFQFLRFWIYRGLYSILFSSHLVLLSNLNLCSFCFLRFFLCVPTVTAYIEVCLYLLLDSGNTKKLKKLKLKCWVFINNNCILVTKDEKICSYFVFFLNNLT